MKITRVAYLLALAALGCSSPAGPAGTASPDVSASVPAANTPITSSPADSAGEPGKDDAVAVLTRVAEALKQGKGQDVAADFKVPAGMPAEAVGPELVKMYERKEISPEGVQLLAEKGEFGKLKELFPKQAERWCERSGVNPDQCYGMKLESGGEVAEVGFAWDGSKLQIIRLDDVGKLK